MDYRAGQIILNAQRDLLKIVSEATGQNYTLNSKLFKDSKLIVTAEIQDGSLQDRIDFGEAVVEAIKNMDSQDICIVFISAIVAYFIYLMYQQHNKTKIEMSKIVSEPDMQTLVARGFDIAEKAVSAPRYIVGKMGEDDTVTVNDGAQLTKKEARAALPAVSIETVALDETPVWVDDVFEIESWGISRAAITIKDQPGTRLEASLAMMIPEETTKLHDQIPSDMTTPARVQVKLRIAVMLSQDKKVLSSYILQVNPLTGEYPTLADLMTPEDKDAE